MSAGEGAPSARRFWPAALLVVAAVLVVYGRTAGHGFVAYDDDDYVYENPAVAGGLTARGVAAAFTSFHAANWHPLTWLSHMLDVALFELEPGGHHLVNVLLHAAAALLLLRFLWRTTRRPGAALAVALLFAVHPLRVESVAWIAERKDVLSGVFWMATLLAWARYAERPSAGRYLVAVLCFVLGLLAKPMLVTLPCVLLLVDVWPLGRWAGSGQRRLAPGALDVPARTLPRLVLEKLPFFALAAVSSWITLRAQASAAAITWFERLPFEARAANALQAYARYAGQAFWPRGLAVFYPHPSAVPALADPELGPVELAIAAALVALTVLSVVRLRREPYLLVGWLWFVGTLVPVVGLFQVGQQAHADRYAYLPLVGLSLALVWSVAERCTDPRARRVATAVAALAVALCALVAWRQVGTWRSTETLWRRALAVTEHNFLAHYNLGTEYLQDKRYAEAETEFRAAIADQPAHYEAHYGLGLALVRLQRGDEAVQHFREALRLKPDYADALVNLGSWHLTRNELDAAAAVYERALALEPRHPVALRNLGHVLFLKGDLRGAAARYTASAALEALPPGAACELAWCLATAPEAGVRNGAEALRWAREAQGALGEEPRALEAVAAAQAELGDFREALAWQERALRATQPSSALDRQLREERLEAYRAGRPWRSVPR